MRLAELCADDLAGVAAVDGGAAWKSDHTLWTEYLADHKAGRRVVLVAWNGSGILAYGTLLWESRYQPLRTAGIPEINNLVVAAHARRRGVATAMIGEFEERARAAGKTAIGLGVGLYADYGPAQRLYIKLGYRPDARGITYGDRPVSPGRTVLVDDNLLLWLIKVL
jgi:GNAT superfamily N-acetyltransferase